MKRIFYIICICLALTGCYKTKSEVKEDCKYLKKVITEAYVNYDELVERGFDVDYLIKNIGEEYSDTFGYENPLDIAGFGEIIAYNITDYFLALDFYDNHLSFKFDKYNNSFYRQKYCYYSNIYFEKKDNNYYVKKSDDDTIKTGSCYTGDLDLLRPVICSNEVLYRYIVLDYYNANITIDLDNKEIPCKAKISDVYNVDNHDAIEYFETANTVYIGLKDCYLNINKQDMEKYHETRNKFDKIVFMIQKSDVNKNVVLDLRGNRGGYAESIYYLLCPIFYRQKLDYRSDFLDIVKIATEGQYSIRSTEINKAILNYQIKNNIAEENRIEPKEEPRTIIGEKNNTSDVFPQLGRELLQGNLFILMDSKTASAAEYGIATSYLINKEKVILVGNKTFGAMSSGSYYSYTLPNSRIEVNLATVNHENETLFRLNTRWHGDTEGFFPDYFADNDTINETLEYLLKDPELVKKLSEW